MTSISSFPICMWLPRSHFGSRLQLASQLQEMRWALVVVQLLAGADDCAWPCQNVGDLADSALAAHAPCVEQLMKRSRACNPVQVVGEHHAFVIKHHPDLSLVLPSMDYVVSAYAKAFGSYDMIERDILVQLVRPGHVVVEAGANIGVYTVPLARAG